MSQEQSAVKVPQTIKKHFGALAIGLSKDLSAVAILQIIQKLFGASAIGLGSYTVHFYNSDLYNSDPYNPSYALSSNEKIALFGAGFCIFSGVFSIVLPRTRIVVADGFMVFIWALSCALMAAGSGLVANDSSDIACDQTFSNCEPITSAVAWRTGIAVSVVAGLQMILFAASCLQGILSKNKEIV